MKPVEKKILQINAYYGSGSTGNIVRDVEAEGNKQGLKMYAIYWLNPNKSDSESVFYLGRSEKKSSVSKIMEWIFAGGKLSYNIDITQRIIDKIIDINPDVIHLHNLHGDFEYGTINIIQLFEALSKMKIKIYWTFHDCWPFTGRCYHFEYKKCDRWKNGCGNCPQRYFDREGIFYDYSDENWMEKNKAYNLINDLTIITVSNWLNSVVKESMFQNREIITIYNGVDVNVFKPTDTVYVSDNYKILCIGWDRRKGYKDYYTLSKMLKGDEKIIVVGKRPFFRKFRKLPDNIVEIDRASSKTRMAEIYSSANVYFNTSPAETFGLTTVEAMSCGVPVVGYDNTATKEVIEEIGQGNQVVPTGDVQDAYKAIETMRTKKVETNSLHKKCMEKFDAMDMIRKYINLYL